MIQQKPLPKLSLLKEYFEYNDGNLIWRRETGKQPKKGQVAGTTHFSGYKTVGFKGKVYRIHRLIYKLMTGEDPGQLYVDHIDGDRTNNRIDNLQLVTAQQNTHKSKAVNSRPKSIKGKLTEYGKQCMRNDYRNRLHLHT